MSPIRRVRVKIGELLIQKGIITPEQLQNALSEQRKKGSDKRLGEILLESGYVNREQLSLALAIQFGYPYININNYTIEPDALSLIPEEIVRKHQVIPIDKIDNMLTLAMVNPLDKVIMEQIQKATKMEIKVFLTTPSEFKEAVLNYYGQQAES